MAENPLPNMVAPVPGSIGGLIIPTVLANLSAQIQKFQGEKYVIWKGEVEDYFQILKIHDFLIKPIAEIIEEEGSK